MKKLLYLGVALLLLAIGTYQMRATIAMQVMSFVMPGRMADNIIDNLPDGLHVALCGAGTPFPDPVRSGPCVAVIAGSRLFVVDAGSGGIRNFPDMALHPGDITAVFLTHLHSDHIDGLGELMTHRWLDGGRSEPLSVFGPPGTEKVVAGFNLAYELDASYRAKHHGEEVAPSSGVGAIARVFPQVPYGESNDELWQNDGIEISSFRVDHFPVDPAVGYLFKYKGRSLLISGDTAKSDNLQSFAAGVELLVHEAMAPHLVAMWTDTAKRNKNARMVKITEDILDYHTSPVEVAEIAVASDVRHLLFYHVAPPLPLPGLEAAFLIGVDDIFKGEVTLGRDGTLITLPSGSDDIVVGRVGR